jgi:hypothetical protein
MLYYSRNTEKIYNIITPQILFVVLIIVATAEKFGKMTLTHRIKKKLV